MILFKINHLFVHSWIVLRFYVQIIEEHEFNKGLFKIG